MAIPPVVVNFITQGLPEVSRAMRSLGQIVEQGQRVQVRANEQGLRARLQATDREAKEKIRALQKIDRFHEQALARGSKFAEKTARDEARAAEKSAKDKIRAFQKADREHEKALAHGARVAEKAARDEARAAEKAAQEKIRAMQKADREREKGYAHGVRLAEKAARDEARALARAEAKRDREAMRWVRGRETYDRALLRRDEGERFARRQEFARNVTHAGSRAIGGAMGVVGGGIRDLAAGVLQIGGGFSIADAAQRQVNLRGAAAKLLAGSRDQSGSTYVARATSESILESVRPIAIAQGLKTEEVLQGIQNFKDLTGNLEQAVRLMPKVAKLATATGGDVAEMGALAGNIVMANPSLNDKQVDELLRVLAKQGQVGGVEVEHMAKYGARLTAGASLIGGDRTRNLATFGAMAQVARQMGGAASPAEAALASQRFATDMQKSATKLQKLGIKVSDGKGGLRDPQEVIEEILTKSKGDVTKLTQYGFGERGGRVLSGFANIYREAGGGEEGLRRVREEFKKYTEVMTEAEEEEANKKRLAEVDVQLGIAMEQLHQAVGEAAIPALRELIPVIKDAAPHMGEFVKGLGAMVKPLLEMVPIATSMLDALTSIIQWAANNPFSGFAALVTGWFMKELAAAQIAATIQRAIAGSSGVPLPGVAPSSGVGGVASAAGGAAGVAGRSAANQAVIGAASNFAVTGGLAAMGMYGAKIADDISQSFDADDEVRRLASNLKSEDAATREAAQAKVERAKKLRSDTGAKAAGWVDHAQSIGALLAGPLGVASKWGTEWALGKAGVQGGSERAVEALQAKDIVDSASLKSAITQAAAEGVRDGVKQGTANMPTPGDRGTTIVQRNAGTD
jgi:Phage-related minor tail protein